MPQAVPLNPTLTPGLSGNSEINCPLVDLYQQVDCPTPYKDRDIQHKFLELRAPILHQTLSQRSLSLYLRRHYITGMPLQATRKLLE